MAFGPGKFNTVVKNGGKSVFMAIALIIVCVMPVSCSGKESVSQPPVTSAQSADLTGEQSADNTPDIQGALPYAAVQASNTSPDNEMQASNISPDAAIAALKLAEEVTDRQNDKVIQTPEDYDNAKMPLLAALPEKEAYLYGVKEVDGGVVLYIGDKAQYFDWPYLTPRFVLPEIQSDDYDKDGSDEFAIDLYYGSGTGVSLEALHVIEITADNSFKDKLFDDYTTQLRRSVSFKTYVKAGGLMGRITINGKNYDVSLKEYQSEKCGKINDDMVLDSIVRFSLDEDRISAEFGAGITSDTIAAPLYIGTVYCDVSYSKVGFELKDIRFVADQV